MFIPSAPVLTLHDLAARERRGWGARPPGRIESYGRGRDALRAAVDRLAAPDLALLLPAYICDSAVAPFRGGPRPLRFYPVDRRLRVDLPRFRELLREHPGSPVVVVHYFGIPDPALPAIIEAAHTVGSPLIEDCAHALYGRAGGMYLGGFGDAAIYSVRKVLPTPDGGVLLWPSVAAGGALAARPTRPLERLRLLVYRGEFALGVSPRTYMLSLASVRRRLTAIDDGAAPPEHAMAEWSVRLLESADAERIVAMRRANFERLASLLREAVPTLEQLMPDLPEGASPLVLPLLVAGGRRGLDARMYRRGISVRALWDVLPREIPLQEFPDSVTLRDGILCLPVHQSLGPRHLRRLVSALRRSLAA